MRFVSVRELRSQSARILGELDRGEAVVTSNCAPVAILTPVTADSVESCLGRSDRPGPRSRWLSYRVEPHDADLTA